MEKNQTKQLAFDLLEKITEYSKEHGREVRGQLQIDPERDTVVMAFSAYPSGCYMAWYADDGLFYLIALVNKTPEIISVRPLWEMDAFQKEIDQIVAEISKK